MAFPRPARPSALIADARAVLRGGDHHKVLIAIASIGITALIVFAFVIDARSGILPSGPQITMVQSWPLTRSDAEIVAQQKIDQKQKMADDAAKRAAFQRLANTLGVDTSK